MTKPKGRLGKSYRIMWDQNSGLECYYNAPMSPEKVAQAHFGFFEGTPVDAHVGAPGMNAGWNMAYPTKVKGMECFVDRLNDPSVKVWRHLWLCPSCCAHPLGWRSKQRTSRLTRKSCTRRWANQNLNSTSSLP